MCSKQFCGLLIGLALVYFVGISDVLKPSAKFIDAEGSPLPQTAEATLQITRDDLCSALDVTLGEAATTLKCKAVWRALGGSNALQPSETVADAVAPVEPEAAETEPQDGCGPFDHCHWDGDTAPPSAVHAAADSVEAASRQSLQDMVESVRDAADHDRDGVLEAADITAALVDARDSALRRFTMADLFTYLGGGICMASMTFFLTVGLARWKVPVLLFFGPVYALIFLLSGIRMEETRPVLSGMSYVCAVCMTPLTVYGLLASLRVGTTFKVRVLGIGGGLFGTVSTASVVMELATMGSSIFMITGVTDTFPPLSIPFWGAAVMLTLDLPDIIAARISPELLAIEEDGGEVPEGHSRGAQGRRVALLVTFAMSALVFYGTYLLQYGSDVQLAASQGFAFWGWLATSAAALFAFFRLPVAFPNRPGANTLSRAGLLTSTLCFALLAFDHMTEFVPAVLSAAAVGLSHATVAFLINKRLSSFEMTSVIMVAAVVLVALAMSSCEEMQVTSFADAVALDWRAVPAPHRAHVLLPASVGLVFSGIYALQTALSPNAAQNTPAVMLSVAVVGLAAYLPTTILASVYATPSNAIHISSIAAVFAVYCMPMAILSLAFSSLQGSGRGRRAGAARTLSPGTLAIFSLLRLLTSACIARATFVASENGVFENTLAYFADYLYVTVVVAVLVDAVFTARAFMLRGSSAGAWCTVSAAAIAIGVISTALFKINLLPLSVVSSAVFLVSAMAVYEDGQPSLPLVEALLGAYGTFIAVVSSQAPARFADIEAPSVLLVALLSETTTVWAFNSGALLMFGAFTSFCVRNAADGSRWTLFAYAAVCLATVAAHVFGYLPEYAVSAVFYAFLGINLFIARHWRSCDAGSAWLARLVPRIVAAVFVALATQSPSTVVTLAAMFTAFHAYDGDRRFASDDSASTSSSLVWAAMSFGFAASCWWLSHTSVHGSEHVATWLPYACYLVHFAYGIAMLAASSSFLLQLLAAVGSLAVLIDPVVMAHRDVYVVAVMSVTAFGSLLLMRSAYTRLAGAWPELRMAARVLHALAVMGTGLWLGAPALVISGKFALFASLGLPQYRRHLGIPALLAGVTLLTLVHDVQMQREHLLAAPKEALALELSGDAAMIVVAIANTALPALLFYGSWRSSTAARRSTRGDGQMVLHILLTVGAAVWADWDRALLWSAGLRLFVVMATMERSATARGLARLLKVLVFLDPFVAQQSVFVVLCIGVPLAFINDAVERLAVGMPTQLSVRNMWAWASSAALCVLGLGYLFRWQALTSLAAFDVGGDDYARLLVWLGVVRSVVVLVLYAQPGEVERYYVAMFLSLAAFADSARISSHPQMIGAVVAVAPLLVRGVATLRGTTLRTYNLVHAAASAGIAYTFLATAPSLSRVVFWGAGALAMVEGLYSKALAWRCVCAALLFVIWYDPWLRASRAIYALWVVACFTLPSVMFESSSSGGTAASSATRFVFSIACVVLGGAWRAKAVVEAGVLGLTVSMGMLAFKYLPNSVLLPVVFLSIGVGLMSAGNVEWDELFSSADAEL